MYGILLNQKNRQESQEKMILKKIAMVKKRRRKNDDGLTPDGLTPFCASVV